MLSVRTSSPWRAAPTLAALLLLVPPALATGTVVGFEGANTGGWSWGPPPVIESSGGHPGAWLHAAPDTFAPQLFTTVTPSAFSGDFRARKIVSLGVDLMTVSTQFAFSRPLSLILGNGSCEIYVVGSALVPQPGTGWKAFDMAIDSQRTTMPPGWHILNGPCTDNNAAWNAVITNVTEVRWFYGDPTFFFIFDIWNVGADNARIYADPFADLGLGLAGTNGVPKLAGTGTLAPGSPMSLKLSSALPGSSVALIVGASALNAAFKGGTLVPNPDLILSGLTATGTGTLTVAATWPTGLPTGVSIWFQEWIVDPGGPQGLSASNGLLGITP